MRPGLDELDRRILEELMKDSSVSLRQLARRLNVPVTTLHERVKRLRKLGAVRRFTIDLDYEVLGYTVTLIIQIRVDGTKIHSVEAVLSRHPNVIALYDVTGEYDLVVIAKFRDMKEADSFIKSLLTVDGIRRTVTSVVLNTVKESICPSEYPGKHDGRDASG